MRTRIHLFILSFVRVPRSIALLFGIPGDPRAIICAICLMPSAPVCLLIIGCARAQGAQAGLTMIPSGEHVMLWSFPAPR